MAGLGIFHSDKPNATTWDHAEAGWEFISKKTKIKAVNQFIKKRTDHYLPAPIAKLLQTMWKVMPLVAILFILPASIVWATFVVTTVVTIVHPEMIKKSSRLLEAAAQGMSFYSAMQAFGAAISISVSANPHLCLVAMSVYLVACGVSYKFSQKMEANRKMKRALQESEQLEGQPGVQGDGRREAESKRQAEQPAAAPNGA